MTEWITNGVLTGEALNAALKALSEGRLWFRVSDGVGCSCNGGDREFRLSPAIGDKPGEWAPRIDDVKICSKGYHATNDPIIHYGCRVAVVEIDEVCETREDKVCCHTMRELGQVIVAVDRRMWVAIHRPFLDGANLEGASLEGASLDGASLDGANLDGANLNRASLNRASLDGASLDGASLNRASLNGASLNGASLNRASLIDASLIDASLNRANLNDANLNDASLDGASLNRANLDGANLDDASLDRANLDDASLDRANLDGATMPDGLVYDGSWPRKK